MPKVHIGEKIYEVWKQSRLKGTEFATLINKDRQVIYDIFKRESIDTQLLQQIGVVLKHDFFRYYYETSTFDKKEMFVSEPNSGYGYVSREEFLELSSLVSALTNEIKNAKNTPSKTENIAYKQKSQTKKLKGS